MKVAYRHLDEAVKAKIITAKQRDNLLEFLKAQTEQSPNFNFTNVLYYLGGLLAIGAMTLFMNLGWETFGGWGLFGLTVLYGILGLSLAHVCQRKNLKIPAGICATFVICLTPLALYALQKAMGWWPDDAVVYRDYHLYIKWHWIFMELGTLAMGVILAWIYRYPFMLLPIAVTLWYLSMDVAVMLSQEDIFNFELRALVSMYFGLVMTLVAFWVDVRSRYAADYAFWLYLFGVFTFWGGLSCQSSDSELSKFFYCCINLAMIGIGVLLVRKVFVILGALGCAFYLGHLAWTVFPESPLFPVALTAIGALIIYLGTLWQKNEKELARKAQSILPKSLRQVLQERQLD
ncbi:MULTISPECIES: DUF2157 domain-containing protein [Legionella]|uniref:DUF2157 domain-containing protein n=1 Tax=Legionella septentrionalis TaxID=2498109 RepID=A0A3S0V4S4_9GAMM|nr:MULTISPECIES: DUF2157 domain-containing protein [Legionella]MCP0912909.1 DUF2157 domain-containing protein [Legionella sp. 27cVA30]RUQ84121.1 DUF2157 domain-containing protein [Legionella septentrionalis]RUQ95688.1 DUF2157 domain-containing protein [Legionella septentrionalis]RUR10101.1 DUF2157 domain-containing protein [Legionella septentrionalis]